MSIQIRKATREDLDAISEIYDQIHASTERGETYTGWLRGVYPVRATAEAALERGDLFIEEADGQPVGTAIINRIQVDVYRNAEWQYPAPDDQIMVLHTLVIDPRAKGHGLGRAFVDFYEQTARDCGCRYLRMDTNALNANARAFYRKLNYREIGIQTCDFNGISNIQLVLLEKKL